MAEGSPLGAPLGFALQGATSHEDIPPPQEWEGCRRLPCLKERPLPRALPAPKSLTGLKGHCPSCVTAQVLPLSCPASLISFPPPPSFFFFGHDVQQLDVGYQFPDQGLNLGLSSESAKS